MIERRFGCDRVIEPARSLPQSAARLEPSGPVRSHEFEIAVERLCLDSTSFRNIRERSGEDPDAMAHRIVEIVGFRGKMHNPETDSGGVALGTVTAVGDDFTDPPQVGDRIVTLASLTLTPLRIDQVTNLDPDLAQVEVSGTAYVNDSAPWGPLPDDLPLATALDVSDESVTLTYELDDYLAQTMSIVPVDGVEVPEVRLRRRRRAPPSGGTGGGALPIKTGM